MRVKSGQAFIENNMCGLFFGNGSLVLALKNVGIFDSNLLVAEDLGFVDSDSSLLFIRCC